METEAKEEPEIERKPEIEKEATMETEAKEEPEIERKPEIEKELEIERELLDSLKGIYEETLQISELDVEERKLICELCAILVRILDYLEASVQVPVEILPPTKIQRKESVLNANGYIITTYKDGTVESRILEDYSPEIIIEIIKRVLPKLRHLASARRQKLSSRVNFFDKINRELRTARDSIDKIEKEKSLQVDSIKKDIMERRKSDGG
jgi:hypothetical protein